MASIFKVYFDRIWRERGEDEKVQPRELEVGETPGDYLNVAALHAEDAIAKVRAREIGYLDEEDQTRVVAVVIHAVEKVGAIDVA